MEVFKMYKKSFKLEQKRGQFLAFSRDFCANICFVRMPGPLKMLKEAALMSSEVMALS